MNALVATKAKVNRSVAVGPGRSGLPQSHERGGQQLSDFLVRVAGRIGNG